jgi:hypothetical protein
VSLAAYIVWNMTKLGCNFDSYISRAPGSTQVIQRFPCVWANSLQARVVSSSLSFEGLHRGRAGSGASGSVAFGICSKTRRKKDHEGGAVRAHFPG